MNYYDCHEEDDSYCHQTSNDDSNHSSMSECPPIRRTRTTRTGACVRRWVKTRWVAHIFQEAKTTGVVLEQYSSFETELVKRQIKLHRVGEYISTLLKGSIDQIIRHIWLIITTSQNKVRNLWLNISNRRNSSTALWGQLSQLAGEDYHSKIDSRMTVMPTFHADNIEVYYLNSPELHEEKSGFSLTNMINTSVSFFILMRNE